MPKPAFSHVETWVFDLDNTLYPPSARLIDQIDTRMTAYIMKALGLDWAAADDMRGLYWRDHGTTLAGLMRVHDLDPGPYLHEVHDISLDHLDPDPHLRAAIARLPGRRIVHTNGSAPYAERVLDRRGLSGVIDAVYGVEHADYCPKPERAAFEAVLARDGRRPASAAMFEDVPRNLEAPHALGMRTVHVAADPEPAPHIHHHTDDLGTFLARLV